VLESPPKSGKYFYSPEGLVSEPLFSAMMKGVLEIKPVVPLVKTRFFFRISGSAWTVDNDPCVPAVGVESRRGDTTIERGTQ
jgi:hypothetical protein